MNDKTRIILQPKSIQTHSHSTDLDLMLSAFAIRNAIFSQSSSSLHQQTCYPQKIRDQNWLENSPQLVLQVGYFPGLTLIGLHVVIQFSLSLLISRND